jgi:2-dehydropantoate 2-reductase
VKSAATPEAARELASVLRPGTPVVSFQNGIDNAATLRAELPQALVLAGMVPFNVVHRADGGFHQGSEGALKAQQHAALASFLDAFARAGLPLQQHADMRAVLWAKLLLNLNNAINALSNQPLLRELAQRDYRRCLALAQREALQLLEAARIPLAKLTPLPMRWVPALLTLPDGLFQRLFARMLTVDPLARSSMLDDLDSGRRTEVDWLCGEVVRLAQSLQRKAPVNARLAELVHAAESGGQRDWPAAALLAELLAAAS